MSFSFATWTDSFVGELNRLTRAKQERLQKALPVYDLTQGIGTYDQTVFPAKILKEVFLEGLAESRYYRPDSMGHWITREAVSKFYQETKNDVSPGNVLITSGSSLSYLYLFRLLCNPGDEILCPTPGYPLFADLASCAGVVLRTYPLKKREAYPHWTLNCEEMENRVTTKTKVIVVVSPHNPTGWVAREKDIAAISAIAERHHLTVIHDEVFSELVWDNPPLPRFLNQQNLTFTLNGLSKAFALPGMKLGWIVASGEEKRVQDALDRLSFIADTFLPTHEATQFALPHLIEKSRPFRASLRRHYEKRREVATELLSSSKTMTLLKAEAGMYGIVTAEMEDEEAVAIRILEKSGFLLHPGAFYEIKPFHLVFTLAGSWSIESLSSSLKKIV